MKFKEQSFTLFAHTNYRRIIFNPWQDHKQEQFSYDENLTYFIISLSWRSLYLDLEEFSCDPTFNREVLMIMLRAENIMRDYLLGKRQDISDVQNHIFFFDRIETASNYDFDKKPSVAMHRSITSYSAYNGKTSFTISNLMGIMIVTFYSMDPEEEWIKTQKTPKEEIQIAKDRREDFIERVMKDENI